MQLALDEARKALWISNPNPRVGCVLVLDDQIIGIGHTQQAGGPHAEIQALNDAKQRGFNTTGATAYVTLEPCCHHGKTPPCTNALINAKIARVIAAMEDPNPLVAGKGLHVLKEAGIEVRCGLFEKEAQEINVGFIKRMQTGMPWVRMKIAASLDGITALPNGKSQWITSSEARLDGHRFRAQACAILTGIGTIKEDNPQLNVRDLDTPRQPIRVVIDSRLEIPIDANIFKSGKTVVFCANVDDAHFLKVSEHLTQNGHEIIRLPNSAGKVDIAKALAYLAQHHQTNEIHVEAGHKLNGSLLRESCVDELLVYLAPKLLGTGSNLANLGPLNSLEEADTWQVIDQTSIGPDIRIRLIKPESK